jgi:hypothetical protein
MVTATFFQSDDSFGRRANPLGKVIDKPRTTLFNERAVFELQPPCSFYRLLIAHDKGKPVAKQGRKAMNLEFL